MFTQKDIQNLRIIYHLVKEQGYTLDGAKKKLKTNKDEVEGNVEIVNRLQDIRRFLVELKENL